MSEFNSGNPIDYTEITLNGLGQKLEVKGHKYAVVQVQDRAGGYALTPDRVALYNRQNLTPNNVSGLNGFIAGQNDTIVFSNAELQAGVIFIEATAFQPVILAVQYYKN